jgi:hypothetical protein
MRFKPGLRPIASAERKSRIETGALLTGLIYDDRGNIK